MIRETRGISIAEAVIVIALVSIVTILMLTALGGNINDMFTKSTGEFQGFQPFGETSGIMMSPGDDGGDEGSEIPAETPAE
jgi:Flp pilus assembly pilin Flp